VELSLFWESAAVKIPGLVVYHRQLLYPDIQELLSSSITQTQILEEFLGCVE
jgi:hypothetical protein